MSCGSCSTKDSGVPNGCKSNGSCGTGSCDKLTVFDWLSNMELPSGQKPFDIVEVRFKNGRKLFCKNEKNLQLTIGEVIAVEGNPGHDIGTVSLTGELVKIQMKKKKVTPESDEIKKIYRKASVKDIDTWQAARDKEIETQKKGREIIIKLGLKMKLSDVEYQGDGNKAVFYYTADERVDFRQLIRELASVFSIRVEMKQIGLRQEAARLGGIGSCGRELCCSTWLTDFRKVNTAAARYQQLSLNPQKLAGQCGKLKCCLNYELDTYIDTLKGFPSQNVTLKTEKGLGIFIKMDIFKEILWYTYKENKSKWFKLSLAQVLEIIEENKQGNSVEGLEEFDAENIEETKIDFENVVGQDSLTRFDEPKRKNKRRKNNKNLKPRLNQSHQKQPLVTKKNTKTSRVALENKKEGSKPVRRSNTRRKPNKPASNTGDKGELKVTNPDKNNEVGNKVVKKSNPRKRPQKSRPIDKEKQGQGAVKGKEVTDKKQVNRPKRKPNYRRKPNPNKPNTNGPAKTE